jgi:uncharacterized protein YjcR
VCIMTPKRKEKIMNGLFEGLNTSDKIRAFKALRKVSDVDLSKLLGVSDETIRNWLKADTWDINDLKKISAEYGVELKDLI